MKKIFLISFIVLLFSCSMDRENKRIIDVSYPDAEGAAILSLELFSDIEIIRLTGTQCPILGSSVNLIVRDSIYYVADPLNTEKVYRFNKNGVYLNSIGSKGGGPNEYLTISDMIVDDSGHVAIYSGIGKGILLTYSAEGKLLEKKTYPYASAKFASANGFNYHYFGNSSGMDDQLYITDSNGETVGKFLPSSMVFSMMLYSPVFTFCDKSLILCPPYGGNIYQLQDEKLEVKYNFDFKAYNIPDEYYQCDTPETALNFLFSKTAAFKNLFFENKYSAILQATTFQMDIGVERTLYGILDKKHKATWEWFYIKEGDFMNHTNLKYLDEEYVYFIAEPELMKNSGLTDRFPLLNTMNTDENVIILKCTLR